MALVFPLLLSLLFHPFLLFFTTYHANAFNSSIHNDALPLLTFKHFVSSDPSNLLAGWTRSSSSSLCRWHGVTCGGGDGRVTILRVTGLRGGELASSIGDISELRVLSIPGNMFSGEIPTSLVNLRELEVLELQGNNFSGRLHFQMSYLESLIIVNLSGNAFSGSIPNGMVFSRNVKIVDLSNNQFSGSIPLNENGFISSCDSLKHLKLSHNFLSGEIPPQIGKCRNLRTLLVDGNILEGRIPREIGYAVELRVLDVSRNSLTGRIPRELVNCLNLSVLVLTDLLDDRNGGNDEGSLEDSFRGEFNAFVGNIPHEVLLLSSLRVLWAPRANLGGRLPAGWTDSCSLRVLNLAENYVAGVVPGSLGMCKNLTFLDLSSNNLVGHLPLQKLRVPCMTYFNVSKNNLLGTLPGFRKERCKVGGIIALEPAFLELEGLNDAYFNIPVLRFQENAFIGSSGFEEITVVTHDFSWNGFVGPLPLFFLGDAHLTANRKVSYMLSLNNNKFNGTLPDQLVSNCNDLKTLSVNLSVNKLSGEVSQSLFLDCLQLKDFEAAYNQIDGSIGPGIGESLLLQRLDLRGNKLSGVLPNELGNLKNMKWMLLGGNNLTGEIPYQLGRLTSLLVLNVSHNVLIGTIPPTLSNATSLEILLLDHNNLSGEIPLSVSALSNLVQLDVSFNNLSGHIPHFQHTSDCDSYKGNKHLHSCPDSYFDSPTSRATAPLVDKNSHSHRGRKLRTVVIALAASAFAVLCTLLGIVLVICFRRSKFSRISSIRRREVVTFQIVPTELSYESVVTATGNFSIRYLIGTGGFGSTYKADLSPGFLVAIKRLSIGKFQGMQQFETEIRTLGRIRHKNLVTLIGYYVGKAEMFLIYNYLSGGNLEAFIHDRSGKNVQWPVIYKIAKDIAEALAYLHYACVPRIVHRDIKPSNILLDENLNAYLSDFGLARLLEVSETHATTDVAGTFGYVAPEYATTCRVSDKADVYSYGVVLLELISGRRSLDPSFSNYGNGFNIVPWAELLMTEGRCSELFSSALWESGPKEKLLGLLKIALTCTEETLSIRPSMKHVLEKLKQLKS
ncbi:LRR receptor-like serine/threonine-protein kinase RPK2 [Cicer arietinum]|uniref:non-specific serine/threonine protein kinase n=1 Tax=Cicer arietinum TaxID=3827 RepID=A0A1S2XQV0_CICAR|nr:LRR receptor-like serine/threonine-protein kinase RPK2 [Cicer arietinum]